MQMLELSSTSDDADDDKDNKDDQDGQDEDSSRHHNPSANAVEAWDAR